MRLAVFVDVYPEISETFVLGEARALAELGHHVRVEAGGRSERPNPDAGHGPPVVYWGGASRGKLLWALARLLAHNPAGCLRDLAGRLRWRREEAVTPLRRIAWVAMRVRASGDQHLHAHFAAGAALNAMRVSRLTGVPYSVVTHGYDLFQSQRNLVEKLAGAAFHVAVSDYTADFVRGIAPERLHKIAMGIDPERFRRTAPYPGGRDVIAVGRLIEKKGFAYLLEAARELPGVRVRIVGDGPLRAELERAAPDNVELLGVRTPAEVRDLLEQSDLLALPCVVAADGDRDSMPVVVKEALAMEVPVVGSDAVGMPEMVRPEWGTLVPPRDAPALAAAIRDLLALPADQRAAMGCAGRAFVVENFAIEAEARKLAALIDGVS
jgi:glycosyltransferase involved in cell wall biosynthesis